jgi:hypothetical protein
MALSDGLRRERLLLHRIAKRLRALFSKEPEQPPEDPHAHVTAPKRPRPSGRSAAAVAEMPEE